jgi:Zn-dependent M28 family amino/carboxypeptidase
MKRWVWILVVMILAGCVETQRVSDGSEVNDAVKAMSADALAENTKALSSDDMQGRAPGSGGEERATQFIAEKFQEIGLEPINNGSYFQNVSMVGVTPKPGNLSIRGKNISLSLRYRDDFVAWNEGEKEHINVSAPLVFLGYGVDAPEYNWNDFKEDVKGKIIVVLINDPPLPDGRFKGEEMTYYGRWTYKFEEAERKGALGCLIIHETKPASYGWNVVESSNTGELFSLAGNPSELELQGWITNEAGDKLLKNAGLNYEKAKELALKDDFRPIDLKANASLTIDTDLRYVDSKNVAGLFEGGSRKDEYILYMGHWDHFGTDDTLAGDHIFNGALDNAIGVSGMIEIAKAFKALKPQAERSIVFLATTGEEQGLLGSEYYAQHPLLPLNKTLAVINIDGANVWGKTKDVVMMGYDQSDDIKSLTEQEVEKQGRYLTPDPNPGAGSFYRSDHFSLAKVGVPSVYVESGIDYEEGGKERGQKLKDEWNEKYYHTVEDEYSEDWDLGSVMQDLELLFRIGVDLSSADSYPQWNGSSEFYVIREQSLGKS